MANHRHCLFGSNLSQGYYFARMMELQIVVAAALAVALLVEIAVAVEVLQYQI